MTYQFCLINELKLCIKTHCSASGSSLPETELVNEVLEYIPRHEEDYLDVTLEVESELIALLNSYLERSSARSHWRAARMSFLHWCEVSLSCKVSTNINISSRTRIYRSKQMSLFLNETLLFKILCLAIIVRFITDQMQDIWVWVCCKMHASKYIFFHLSTFSQFLLNMQ